MPDTFHPCLYTSDSSGSFAENIRRLRSAILQFQRAGKHFYLVTSCWEGEGKTTVCINLAAALREFGLKVLLVDADLRQRSLTRFLNLSLQPGPVTRESDLLPGVTVMPAVEVLKGSPSDLLAQSEYQVGLSKIMPGFDVVLVDTPPLSACNDATLLGRLVDGALMMVSEARFQGITEGHFSEDLRERGIPILGVVVTGSTGN